VKSGSDAGVAIMTLVMVTAVVTALVLTAGVVTVNNLTNARADRQSLSALSTSEAGVSAAIARLRTGNLASLTCTEPAAGTAPGSSCTGTGPSWVSATNPMQVMLDGTTGTCTTAKNCFKVWIGTVQQYVPNCPARHASPPGACSGIYRVHSTGIVGSGPGARRLAVDVKVTPYPFPIGVFAENFSGNGDVGIHSESLFTNGCMMNRQDDSHNGSGTQFQWDSANNRPVLDLVYDQPAAAHAVGHISTSNNSCDFGSGGGPIHLNRTGNGNNAATTQVACNGSFKYDQDGDGGSLTSGDGCYGAYTRSDGTVYPTTSKFDAVQLAAYGYRPRGLTDAQYAALKSQAQSEGTYNLSTSSISSVLTNLAAAGVTSPVLYWDNADVALGSTDFPAAFQRNLNNSAGCSSSSVTIVVDNGHNLSYHGGNTAPFLVASLFVPDGQITGNGGRNIIGTVFAKTLDLGGNVDFYMDQCFANNPPGGVLDAQITNWREDDATDVN
jgi:hypothetical protein